MLLFILLHFASLCFSATSFRYGYVRDHCHLDFYVDLEEECHEEIDEVIPKYPANAKSYFIGMLHRL